VQKEQQDSKEEVKDQGISFYDNNSKILIKKLGSTANFINGNDKPKPSCQIMTE